MGWAQHCRVLGELEPTVRLHVAYDDISVVRLGDAVAERLERLDGLLDPLLEHGTWIDPQPEVPAPKAWRDAQRVVDYGDGLDVGVDVEPISMVSLMNEPIPFAYATECLIEIRPVSKSTSHHRRPQTSPIRIPVCRASTTAL